MVRVIVNPYRAKGLKAWKEVKKRIDECGIECDFVMTGEQAAGELAKKAREEGVERIFVVGGDGTINEVVNGVDAKGIVLGIIPAGRGNDFAKMLGIESVEDGISSLSGGHTKSVDVGLANDRYFVNNLGVGAVARAVGICNRLRKITGRPGYLVGALSALFECRPFDVEVESRDFRFSGEALGIAVGNGRFHGGLFALTPEAEIDDGLLDVCVIGKIGRVKGVLSIPRAIRGTHTFLKEAETFRTDCLRIHSETAFSVHFDGELAAGRLNKLEVKVLNKQLEVCVAAKMISGG
ncbi:MAG: diacylglycerol kinase family lipid kinase [Planctomycetota bacterium]|nr:MAG: diacylglycerol kinase family lipid kinase [Planctomycetota bacterium]